MSDEDTIWKRGTRVYKGKRRYVNYLITRETNERVGWHLWSSRRDVEFDRKGADEDKFEKRERVYWVKMEYSGRVVAQKVLTRTKKFAEKLARGLWRDDVGMDWGSYNATRKRPQGMEDYYVKEDGEAKNEKYLGRKAAQAV